MARTKKGETFRVTATISAENYAILKKRLAMPPLNQIPRGVISDLFDVFLKTYINYPELIEICQKYNLQKELLTTKNLEEEFPKIDL